MHVSVDLRKSFGTVRYQGYRPTCLACSISDAHQYRHGIDEQLSAEFLFYWGVQNSIAQDPNEGLTFEAGHKALTSEGQPLESSWPYLPTQPYPWEPPDDVGQIWKRASRWKETTIYDETLLVLQTGIVVVIGIQLTSEFLRPLRAPYTLSSGGTGFGRHAVLAVGLAADENGSDHLLIRNSWGENWGDCGHAWIPLTYLDTKFLGYLVVE